MTAPSPSRCRDDMALEASVVGMALADPGAAVAVAKIVAPDDFTRPSCRATWQAIRTICECGEAPSLVAVAKELKRVGATWGAGTRDITGRVYDAWREDLLQWHGIAPHPSALAVYAERLTYQAACRRLALAARTVLDDIAAGRGVSRSACDLAAELLAGLDDLDRWECDPAPLPDPARDLARWAAGYIAQEGMARPAPPTWNCSAFAATSPVVGAEATVSTATNRTPDITRGQAEISPGANGAAGPEPGPRPVGRPS